MKTIILTGGSGFIGSHMLLALAKRYPKRRIINADAETYAARPPLYVQRPKNVENVNIDIRDALAVHRLLNLYKPDTIVHMAAESHVCRSITGPKNFITTNINGTFNLLEEFNALPTKSKRFLHVSTDEVYGEIRSGKFTERSPFAPRSPYSASKASSDLLVKAYCETYRLPTVTVNMSNNFGPNQHEEKLVPKTITKILTGQPVEIYGKGDHVRDWLFVEDACRGILAALERGKAGESYCLGGDIELTNLEMVDEIHSAIDEVFPADGIELNLKYINARPTDDFRYALDVSKAKKDLKWEPASSSFFENLKLTVNWYAHAILASERVSFPGKDL